METFDVIKEAIKAKNRVKLWQSIFSGVEAKSICEVGVFRGEFAEQILHNCPLIKTYYMVDPWRHLDDWNKPANKADMEFKEIYKEAMERTSDFSSKRIVLKNTTISASKAIEDASLDASYIDGDHTLRGITIDLIHMLPKIRRGGIIGGDDFTTNIWQHGVDFSPTEVYPFALYFAEAMNLPIFTLPYSQFCIVNAPDIGFQVIDLGDYSGLTPKEIYWPKDFNTSTISHFKKKLPDRIKKPIKRILGLR